MPLFRRKHGDDQQFVDPDDRSPELGLKYKDLAVLGQLMKAGADLEQPRHALYFLFFGSQANADAALHEARGRSFESTVSAPCPEHPGQWAVTCERRDIVLDVTAIRDNGDFFDALAQRHGGEYDGWEASV